MTKKSAVKTGLHWERYRLADSPEKTPRYILYLFDKSGTIRGYVENTATGDWRAYVGLPGRLIDTYGTDEQAMEVVTAEMNAILERIRGR